MADKTPEEERRLKVERDQALQEAKEKYRQERLKIKRDKIDADKTNKYWVLAGVLVPALATVLVGVLVYLKKPADMVITQPASSGDVSGSRHGQQPPPSTKSKPSPEPSLKLNPKKLVSPPIVVDQPPSTIIPPAQTSKVMEPCTMGDKNWTITPRSIRPILNGGTFAGYFITLHLVNLGDQEISILRGPGKLSDGNGDVITLTDSSINPSSFRHETPTVIAMGGGADANFHFEGHGTVATQISFTVGLNLSSVGAKRPVSRMLGCDLLDVPKIETH